MNGKSGSNIASLLMVLRGRVCNALDGRLKALFQRVHDLSTSLKMFTWSSDLIVNVLVACLRGLYAIEPDTNPVDAAVIDSLARKQVCFLCGPGAGDEDVLPAGSRIPAGLLR